MSWDTPLIAKSIRELVRVLGNWREVQPSSIVLFLSYPCMDIVCLDLDSWGSMEHISLLISQVVGFARIRSSLEVGSPKAMFVCPECEWKSYFFGPNIMGPTLRTFLVPPVCWFVLKTLNQKCVGPMLPTHLFVLQLLARFLSFELENTGKPEWIIATNWYILILIIGIGRENKR